MSTAPASATPATATPAAGTPATSTPGPAASEAVFSREALDQMVAPIALYPDPLLAQVLMASTYPGNVADAVAWSKAHPQAKGDEAVKQVAGQPWDPSVQSLVAFPQALATLGQDPAWVQRLGDAFLAQPDQVMDAVQRLRRQAQAAGNLASNQYQSVSVQDAAPAPAAVEGDTVEAVAAPAQTIVIQPADPAVVYVPSYNPATVYGSWAYPAYPPAYYPPPPGYYAGSALAAGLAFGVGVAITDSLWGGLDWHHDDVDINVNRYNNINVNRRLDVNQNTWRHDPVHRDGVPYRDRASREQYGRQLDGADRRAAFRGDDPARAQEREKARASMQQRGFEAPARDNQQARERAREASERGGDRSTGARPSGADRDPARQRAQAAADATHRAGTSGQGRAQAAQRSANAGQGARTGQGARPPAAHRQTQGSNAQVRQQARQHAQPGAASRQNAFQGASHPSASRSQVQRGHASQAAASRPAASRPAARPVQRPSHPPQRQGGGGRRH